MTVPLNGNILIARSVALVDVDTSLVGSGGFVPLSDAEVLVSGSLDAYVISKLVRQLP